MDDFLTAIRGALRDLLLPYQAKWLADRSRYKVGCWSRQSGKSFVLTLEAVLQAVTDGNNQALVAASERQALENMEKVHLHLRFLQVAIDIWCRQNKTKPFPLLGGTGKPAKHEVRLFNNARILALPANPLTIRGFTGDVFWDEAALTQHDREIWKAILPISTRNFRVRVTSTPLGDNGMFAWLWNKGGEDGNSWSRHMITLPEAVDQGLRVNADEIRESCDEETWEQEYLCRFISDATSYFPWELLRQASDNAPELDDVPAGVPIWLGVDLGRKRDLTALIDAVELAKDHVHLRELEVLRKAPFEVQEERIDAALSRPNLQRGAIDATWNSSVAERARKKHGPKVEEVVFSNAVKERMVTETRRLMERGQLTIEPGNRDLLNDLHSIRRYVTAANNIRFDADRTSDRGHADRAWAGMLAVWARSNRAADWRMDLVGPEEIAIEAGPVRPAGDSRPQAQLEQAATDQFWSGLLF